MAQVDQRQTILGSRKLLQLTPNNSVARTSVPFSPLQGFVGAQPPTFGSAASFSRVSCFCYLCMVSNSSRVGTFGLLRCLLSSRCCSCQATFGRSAYFSTMRCHFPSLLPLPLYLHTLVSRQAMQAHDSCWRFVDAGQLLLAFCSIIQHGEFICC